MQLATTELDDSLGHNQGMAPMPLFIPEELQRRICLKLPKCYDKGSKLLQMMLAGDHEADQLLSPAQDSVSSAFLNYDALERWGYMISLSALSELYHMADGVKDLLNTIGFESAYAEEGGNNIAIRHEHKSFFFEGKVYDGNMANFAQIVNTASGFIVAVDNRSPLQAFPTEKYPDLKFWSDVAFLQWQSCASETSDLKYVLRYGVVNTLSTAVVYAINRVNKTKTEKWPGITYQAGSMEGKLLMGAPNGSSVAYLLIQHKKQLGHKTIEKITVFEIDGFGFMLLFRIVDMKEKSKKVNGEVSSEPWGWNQM